MTLVGCKANFPPLSSFISPRVTTSRVRRGNHTDTQITRASNVARVRPAASLPAQSATKQGARPDSKRRRYRASRVCISRAAGSRIERQVDAWIKYRPVNDRQVDYEISLKSRTVRRHIRQSVSDASIVDEANLYYISHFPLPLPRNPVGIADDQ